MPSSKKPRRPFKGNKFLIQSKEYQELNRKMFDIVQQLQQVQAVVLAMLQGPADSAKSAELPNEEWGTIPQETWDALEEETERLVEQAANEAVYETMQELAPETRANPAT